MRLFPRTTADAIQLLTALRRRPDLLSVAPRLFHRLEGDLFQVRQLELRQRRLQRQLSVTQQRLDGAQQRLDRSMAGTRYLLSSAA